jgi:hypothetical protein
MVDSCADRLMDVGLLPEIAETAADAYLRGLRDGGSCADHLFASITTSDAAITFALH